MIQKKTKSAYFYTVKSIDIETFKSKNIYKFFDAYRKIFLIKMSMLLDNPKEDILNICNCGISMFNSRISAHVLNTMKCVSKSRTRIDLGSFLEFFRITWKVRVESVDCSEVSRILGSNHELSECKNVHAIIWKHPILTEKKDPEGKLYWIKNKWDVFQAFFDMNELQNKLPPNAKFKNEARITCSQNGVLIALAYEFD